MPKLKTIDIQGKPYVTVNARLTHFRENCEGYQLTTEILKHDDESCLIKASVLDSKGVIISTGHAYERITQGFINKTSHVENCETSAVGRALAIFGIGIDAEVRSYEEMSNAIDGQKTPRKKKGKESVYAKEQTVSKNDIQALLQDYQDVDKCTELWWKLTKEQQEDADIKFYFTTRKEQINA